MNETRVAGGFLALVAAIVIVKLVVGWMSTGADVISAENVTQQWAFAYQYEESLKSEALQICNAEKALAAATNIAEQTQRRSQVLAMQNNYHRIAQEFDARLRNAFEAKLVAPPDVARVAPSLSAMVEVVCASSTEAVR
jgi:hypothetical protein